jgi:hypothetical protein
MTAATSSGARTRRRTLSTLFRSESGPTGTYPYIIYSLRHCESGLAYVGLTKRRLRDRVAAHVSQSRRKRFVRPGGLLQAIRDTEAAGLTIDMVFKAEAVCWAKTVSEAKKLERFWIAKLQAAQPLGYNAMPGGASVGSPANSKTVRFEIVQGRFADWPSIDAAATHCNTARVAAGRRLLRASTYYARLRAGWSYAETFEVTTRVDGRALRPAIQVGGVECRSLREIEAITGVGISALRSRLHRRQDPTADVTQDRRFLGRRRAAKILLTWPPTGEHISLATFASRAGLPKASTLHRWHRMAGERIDTSDAEAVSAWLRAKQDRRKKLCLVLPDGDVWRGGQRELVRRLLQHGTWSAMRSERIGESAIFRRIRALKADELINPSRLRWAFGFVDPSTPRHKNSKPPN